MISVHIQSENKVFNLKVDKTSKVKELADQLKEHLGISDQYAIDFIYLN